MNTGGLRRKRRSPVTVPPDGECGHNDPRSVRHSQHRCYVVDGTVRTLTASTNLTDVKNVRRRRIKDGLVEALCNKSLYDGLTFCIIELREKNVVIY